jgi:hypothetical protein
MYYIKYPITIIPWVGDFVWVTLLTCCSESKKVRRDVFRRIKLDLSEEILECRYCGTIFHFKRR